MLSQNEIKSAVRTIAPKYGIESVYLFGSYARGTANEHSDVDFRIVGGNIESLYDIAALRLDLEEALGREVDVALTENMRESFYKSIRDEEALLYGGD
ncbi:MAG: nucleotidyltransferase domain-containing protein [Deltaproteobacteria bacterium]|jgi:predicted nucleotidyltransferase|nr:nucleotidyltransferase domain-containing protein [Deltaproteobacteria bacterium]